MNLYCPSCETKVHFKDQHWYVAWCHLCNTPIAKCDWLTKPKKEQMTIRKAVVSYDTDTKKYALLEISPFGDHQPIVSGIELSSELGEEIRRWFTQGEES